MKKMLLAAMLAAVAGGASAQGYVGALAGLTKVSSACLPNAECDDTDHGYKLYAGYDLHRNFALEVGYTNFGKTRISRSFGDAKIHGTAFSLVGALKGQFAKDLTGVARLGLAATKGKLSSTYGENGSSESMQLYAGLGLEYAVTAQLKLSGAADYTTVDYKGDSGSTYIFGLGAQYGF